MKRILSLIIVLLIFAPYPSSADEPSDEQKRVDAINKALKSTVKVSPKGRLSLAAVFTHGTGFFISSDTIITNWHVVVEMASALKITKSDGTTCTGHLGYRDEIMDLALVKVDCTGDPISLSKTVQYGQDAYAIGSAQVDFAVTQGIVSSLESYGHMVIDAHVNQGNSGSPVINSQGEIIGVVKGFHIEDPAYTYVIKLEKIKAFLARAG